MATIKIDDAQMNYMLNLAFAEHVRARGLDEKTTQAYIEYYYDLIDNNYFGNFVDVKSVVLKDMLGGTIVFHNKKELLDMFPDYKTLDEFAESDHCFFVARNGYIILAK